jgi:hypothetical protein
LALDALLRLESEGIINSVNVQQSYDETTDIVFNRVGGEGFLMMATTNTELVRVVGRRRECDVAPEELEQTIREWPGRYRWRTRVRTHLPLLLSRLVLKGRDDCGQHEWYKATDAEDRCYHCSPGVRRPSGFG